MAEKEGGGKATKVKVPTKRKELIFGLIFILARHSLHFSIAVATGG